MNTNNIKDTNTDESVILNLHNDVVDAFNELDTPVFKSLFNNAFDDGGRNIFLVKWTYRFLR